MTNEPGQDIQPAFSPDGNSIAFISTRSSRTGLIRIGGTLARNVRTYGGDLWVAPALGGSARRLASDANSPVWKPDGQSVIYVSGTESHRTIMEVPARGGAPRALLGGEQSTWEWNRISCSADGRWISLEDQLAGILLMPSAGGKPHPVVPNGFGHAWDASSRLYFVTANPQGGTALQFVAIDSNEGILRGVPHTIGLVTGSLWEAAASGNGLRIAASEEEASRHLTRLALTPGGASPSGGEEPLSAGRVIDGYPAVSPDNRQVAYVSDILGHSEVWILDLETRQRRRLQLPGDDITQTGPAWMPDGRHIVLSRLMDVNVATNWLVAVDGSGAEEILTRTAYEGVGWLLAPTKDAKSVLYPAKDDNGVQQIHSVDLASRKSTRITKDPGNKFDIVISPDGKSMAVTAIHEGVIQLFLTGINGGPMQKLTTGSERMRHPFFSPDGKWIYIQPSHRNVYRVHASGGTLEQVTRFPDAGLFLEEPTISPDGRYLYYCRGSGSSSLWLITMGPAGPRNGRPRLQSCRPMTLPVGTRSALTRSWRRSASAAWARCRARDPGSTGRRDQAHIRALAKDPGNLRGSSGRPGCSPRSAIRGSGRSTASRSMGRAVSGSRARRGRALSDTLDAGPLEASRALALAAQVAEALAAAHEKGVVHRDLKPANVRVTPDGRAKVLDFGLAKAVAPTSGPPKPADSMTATGVIVGTPSYMSPEQSRGKAVDARTDLWAFGCLLYEMLTGKKAFGGASVPDIFAAVLHDEPDWKRLPRTTNGASAACCSGVSRRNRSAARRRARSAGRDPGGFRAEAAPPANAQRRDKGPAPARPDHALRGFEESPVFSPSGDEMAYAADRGGVRKICLRRASGGEERALTSGAFDDIQPSFSPDGDTIAFVRGRERAASSSPATSSEPTGAATCG